MNWNDPVARARLLERLGAVKYNAAMASHVAESTVATIGGHGIRPVGSRFGQIWMVGGLGVGFATRAAAEKYAAEHPLRAASPPPPVASRRRGK